MDDGWLITDHRYLPADSLRGSEGTETRQFFSF